jgi:hypothetical protein
MHDGAVGSSTPVPEADDMDPDPDAGPSSAQVRRRYSSLLYASPLVRPLSPVSSSS